jgi:mRNA interferase RelE/StbE
MIYDVQLSDGAEKNLAKIDRYQAKIIISWIEKNLKGCENPRLYGKPLVGNKKGYWRYRVGDYRIIADIQDKLVRIEIICVGHRREVYDD